MAGRIVTRNQPCRQCSSSDAAQHYEDGWTHCFSCGKNYRTDPTETPTGVSEQQKRGVVKRFQPEVYEEFPVRGMKHRLIPTEVCDFYGVRCEVGDDGQPEKFFFPFKVGKSQTPTGYKIKSVADKKDTHSVGEVSTCFGLDRFRGGGRRLIITEGEEDCLSVQTANRLYYDKFYPVISMGGVSQVKFLLENREELRRYEEIILWFDNDEQGQLAVEKAAKILGYDKVQVAVSQQKDANDCLKEAGFTKKGAELVLRNVWDAKPFSPASIVKGEDTWEKFQEFKNIEYVPWPPFLSKLNEMTFGRALGSITMIAAGTSVGKSSLLREDLYHLLKTTDEKIGACFLEESVGETVAGLMALHMNKRFMLPTVESTEEEQREAWESTVGNPRVLLVDHQGSVSDGSLIDKIEYLALAGCKYIYLDHITIAVSESEERDTNKAIDSFMSSLLKLVKRHNIWIGVVSHLRKVGQGEETFETGGQIKEDDLKGSGSLKQISFQTIAISRNKLHPDREVRNSSQIWLLKDRRTGETGPAGAYRFDPVTGRMQERKIKDGEFVLDTSEFVIE